MNADMRNDRLGPGFSTGRISRTEKVGMAAVVVAGTIGLIWFSFKVVPDHQPANEPRPRANEPLRTEVERIYVPAALIKLAEEPATPAALESHETIAHCLRERGLENVWYAITFRQFQTNSEPQTVGTYCRPSQSPTKAVEFRSILETLAGNPPVTELADYSTAEITVIPENLAVKEPGGAFDELMKLSK